MTDKINGRPATYLGDGLYAVSYGHCIVLLTNDPHKPTDTVYLDPAVLRGLVRLTERMEEEG